MMYVVFVRRKCLSSKKKLRPRGYPVTLDGRAPRLDGLGHGKKT